MTMELVKLKNRRTSLDVYINTEHIDHITECVVHVGCDKTQKTYDIFFMGGSTITLDEDNFKELIKPIVVW